MNLEALAKEVGIIVLGVLVAGIIMNQFGASVSLIGSAESGFNGGA